MGQRGMRYGALLELSKTQGVLSESSESYKTAIVFDNKSLA